MPTHAPADSDIKWTTNISEKQGEFHDEPFKTNLKMSASNTTGIIKRMLGMNNANRR